QALSCAASSVLCRKLCPVPQALSFAASSVLCLERKFEEGEREPTTKQVFFHKKRIFDLHFQISEYIKVANTIC
ncbi:MAG: hypothetical protein IJT83_09485, partial [Victivallales bacterium]|nr:hypothetical protein [Victivallales bacterium]